MKKLVSIFAWTLGIAVVAAVINTYLVEAGALDELDVLSHRFAVFGGTALFMFGIAYMLPSFAFHFIHRSPPGVLSLLQGVLTVLAIGLGIQLLGAHNLHLSLQESIRGLFLVGEETNKLTAFFVATGVATLFMLGNFLRSYFNLHRIEESSLVDELAAFVGGFAGKSKAAEVMLRVAMVALILLVENELIRISQSVRISSSVGATGDAVTSMMASTWEWAIGFYVVAIAWDCWLLRELRNRKSPSVNAVMLWQALPVHLCGFVTATLLVLSRVKTLHSWSYEFSGLAVIFAVLGIVLLGVSLVRDRKVITSALQELWSALGSFRNRNNPQTQESP